MRLWADSTVITRGVRACQFLNTETLLFLFAAPCPTLLVHSNAPFFNCLKRYDINADLQPCLCSWVRDGVCCSLAYVFIIIIYDEAILDDKSSSCRLMAGLPGLSGENICIHIVSHL